jgi:hypothetical protein
VSIGTPGNAATDFMPSAARLHCILCDRDLGMLALILACAVGQLILGVY